MYTLPSTQLGVLEHMSEEYEIDYEVGEGWHAWTDPVTGKRIVEHDLYQEEQSGNNQPK